MGFYLRIAMGVAGYVSEKVITWWNGKELCGSRLCFTQLQSWE